MDKTHRKYDILTPDDIDDGRVTDAYFETTEEVLEYADRNPEVVAEVGEETDDWHVFAGLKDVAQLLEGKPVDVYSVPEGTLFRNSPVMRIEGDYLDFGRYETALLGFICKASGVATKAMRAKAAAGDRTVLSFGTRRQHPATAGMIERSALIGGMDGISNVAGGEAIGVEAGGTMPHALVISMGDQEEAWLAYDEALDESVPRVLLCDTYDDEKKEATRAVELLDNVDSVRLDTTSSRRGDMKEIAEEVRWELDARGYEDVGIFVSGGVDAGEILELRDVVDGFGVGGYVANADPVDFSLDIVEVDGEFAAKRGTKSGAKEIYRDYETMEDTVVYTGGDGEAPDEAERLMEPVIDDGEILTEFSIEDARQRVEEGVERVREKQDDCLFS
ncbi:MAG: nicotinate phosphoribosyltransferase [Halobacteria archaeon]|nr:nicotinate phosphoribosyltransferase [Halobacteria archaeon]